jgi:O-antigen/teichoic acid export membrane protein
VAKDIFKSSIAYTILGFLPLSFAVIFTPIYLKYLNETEYGILSLFTLYTGFIAQAYSLGVSSAFGYIYWDVYKDKVKLKELISSALGLLLSIQALFILITLLFGKPIFEFFVKSSDVFTFNPYLILALAYSAFLVFYEMILYFFRNEGDYKKYATLSIMTLLLLTIGTLIGVVGLDLKALGAIIGRTLGYGLVISSFIVILIIKYGISFNLKLWKDLLKFGLPLFASAIIGSIGYGMDRLLIERFDSLETLGVYAFALVVITVIETFFNALNNALSPVLYKYVNEFADLKKKEIQALSHSIVMILMLAITVILALINPLMDLLISNKDYHLASQYVPILAVAFLWRIFSTYFQYPLFMNKKTKRIAIIQFIFLISMSVFGALGYYLYGMLGIVFGVYLARTLDFLIARFYSIRTKQINFSFKNLILVTVLLSLVATAITIDNTLFMNKYITFCVPLIAFVVLTPVFLRKEMKLIYFAFLNRKSLFD